MGKWKKPYNRERRWNRRALIARDDCRCGVCGGRIEQMKDVTLDHITPRSRGGSDTIDNLQLAHYRCNQSKADLLPDEWAALQGR